MVHFQVQTSRNARKLNFTEFLELYYMDFCIKRFSNYFTRKFSWASGTSLITPSVGPERKHTHFKVQMSFKE